MNTIPLRMMPRLPLPSRLRTLPFIFCAGALLLTRSAGLCRSQESVSRHSGTTLSATDAQPQDVQGQQVLELEQRVERELTGHQSHSYAIKLAAGQYLKVVVEQRGIDVVVRLFSPAGEKMLEVDSPNGTHGPELLIAVAEATGLHRFEVAALEEGVAAGKYEAKVDEVRAATEKDKKWLEAGKAYTEGQSLIVQGVAEALQGAIKKYEEALRIYTQVKDEERIASTLSVIGEAYLRLDEQQKALDYFTQALPLLRAVGDRGKEGFTLDNIGNAYIRLGMWNEALNYLTQALQLHRVAGNQVGEAFALNGIGGVHTRMGDLHNGLDYLTQALTVRRAVGDRRGEAATLNDIGNVRIRLNEQQKALGYLTQALPLWRVVGDRGGEAATLSNIGDAHFKMNEMQKSLDYHMQALPLWRVSGGRLGEAYTLNSISRTYEGLANWQKALESNSAALAIVEDLRFVVRSNNMRASYFSTAQRYYLDHINLLMQLHQQHPAQGYDAQAFHVSERTRARSLLDLLNESRTDIRRGVPRALLERERSLQQMLAAKAERQVRLLNTKATDEEKAMMDKEVRGLTSEYQQVQAQIRQQSPNYAALTQPQPLTLADVQQRVLDPDALLLQYSLGEKRSYLWAVTPKTVRSYELPPGKHIEAAARRVYELLTARQQRVQETEAQYEARVARADLLYVDAARTLSQMVLGPATGELGTKRLVVIADGALQYVPFAALPEPEHSTAAATTQGPQSGTGKTLERRGGEQPLIVMHEVINLPSASALAILRQEAEKRVAPAQAVAVLADPVFDKDDPRLKIPSNKQVKQARTDKTIAKTSSPIAYTATLPVTDAGYSTTARALRGLMDDRATLARLVFSREEARHINAAAPVGHALLATDFAANRRTALSGQLGQYRYVHFATHGILNAEHPELSGIVLSLVDENGNPQEGFLGLSEIYNLRLPVEMVVLSACQTGLGKEVKGEGLVGLTRGFMYAGAKRVVASLWKVEDGATAEMMKRMYVKMLRDGERPAAALRRAQLEMQSRKQWQAPYYWAGFVMQGEWR